MADNTVSYACPHCGAALAWKPGDGQTVCGSCGTSFGAEELDSYFAAKLQSAAAAGAEVDAAGDGAAEAGGPARWSEAEAGALALFTCSACGAEVACDANTMATECCYCGNQTMLPSRFTGGLKPDYVLPFRKTKEEAKAALRQFYEGKWLLPTEFKAENRLESVQPLYVPFWLFDAEVEGRVEVEAKRIHTYRRGDTEYTTTEVYRCEREGRMSFTKVPADGSRKMDDEFMESIEPYDYTDLQPFSAAYLPGFLADRYDVGQEEMRGRAEERMCGSALETLAGTVTGYTMTSIEGQSAHTSGLRAAYALAPVWILTTRYKGQPYTFMMNGQTGKVVGRLPWSVQRSWLAFLLAFVVLTFVLGILFYELEMDEIICETDWLAVLLAIL